MKQIKNKFGILGESHGQDRKHKEEITIFKNPAENQQRNKENNILEVLGQALRKQKNLQKTKKIIFQNSFWRHPKFQDLEKTKKTKRTKQNNISELFLETPQIPGPGKTKKTKRTKKNNISELFLETPQIPRPLENCFFCFFCFFWFSAGFCQEA